MRGLISDFMFTLRHAIRRPVVTAVAVSMLALGIGTATAMFTVIDGVLLRALPYRDPGHLVSVWETFPHWRGQPTLDAQWDRIALSYSEYQDVSKLDRDFEGVAAAYWRETRLTGSGDPIDLSVARGSAGLLPLLGGQMELGRWFLPGEEGPSAPELAVLPHQLWMERFGGSRDVLGKTVTLDGRAFEIVGVLPASFAFTSVSVFATPADRTAIWTPIGAWPGDMTEGSQNYEVIARVRTDVAVEQARIDVARVIRGDRSAKQHDARIVSRQDAEVAGVSTSLLALMAAVLTLLVITCGNLGALLLGEAAGREAEMRTRLALGASAGRIVRQLLAEYALLALAGGVLGVGLAAMITRALVLLAPIELPHADLIAVNGRVLLASLLVSGAASLAFGLAPALALARTGLYAAQSATRAASRSRSNLQHALIAAQVALSVVLLVASGLFVRTLSIQKHLAPGFETAQLLVMPLSAPTRTGVRASAAETQHFYDTMTELTRAMPGVVDVTTTSNVPIVGNAGTWAVTADPTAKLTLSSPAAQHNEVSPGFFEMMGIHLLSGRTLTIDDRTGAPLVAVVNETMARQLWPRESAIGKPFLAPNGGRRVVVGIVSDIRERGMARPPQSTFYQSVHQIPASHQSLIIRVQGNPLAIAPAVQKAEWTLDPTLPAITASTMEQIVYQSLSPARYRAGLMMFFAMAAAAMTAIGVAGVAMRAVAGQMRELCIRMAIGATSERVMRLVIARYVRLAAIGLAAGVALSLVALRLTSAYLVGVSTRDPATMSVVAAAVLAMVLIAAWLPSRRLPRVNLAEQLGRY